MPTEPAQSASTSYAQPWVPPHQLARSNHRHLCEDGQTRLLGAKSPPPNSAAQLSGQDPREAYGYSPGKSTTYSIRAKSAAVGNAPQSTRKLPSPTPSKPPKGTRRLPQSASISTTSPGRGYSPLCGIPVQVRYWTCHFLPHRQTAFNGQQEPLQPLQAGIPHGSHRPHRHRPSSSYSTAGHYSTN